MKFKNILSSFFAHKMTQQVKELYSSNLILNFAISAVNIYEPVFVFLLFSNRFSLSISLQYVLFFYLGVYVLYFFTLPLGAKIARRFGYEHTIAYSSIFTILFYLSLFGSMRFFWLIIPAVLMYVGSKTLYWPSYHSDFARFSSDGQQGRQISNLTALNSLVFIAGPLIGGLVLEYFGFKVLFVIVAIVIMLSNIPLFLTKEIFEPRDFSYFASYRRIFKKKHRKKFLAHLGFGEELIALTIWPIFIYLVVGDFLKLGLLTAGAVLISTIIFLYIGRTADVKGDRKVLRLGALSYFFSWIFRIFARGLFGIFLVDSYSRISKQAVAIPIVSLTYEKAQDTSVMKSVVFFEMSLIVGKILAIVLSLLLLQIFTPGWNAIFILAGLMTLLYLLF